MSQEKKGDRNLLMIVRISGSSESISTEGSGSDSLNSNNSLTLTKSISNCGLQEQVCPF